MARITSLVVVLLVLFVTIQLEARYYVVPRNLATRQKTSQSSTGWGGVSRRAIDRIKAPKWSSYSCTYTNNDLKAWWKVELGQSYLVSNVKITNRGDYGGWRLSNFDVKVGSNLCKYHPNPVTQGATIDIICNKGAVGNAVMIQLRGRNTLTLCEVQVFGVPAVDPLFPRNLATGKKTSQSSTGSGISQRAIDRSKASKWSSNSCTSTNNDLEAWWKVELGQRYVVSNVIIIINYAFRL